MVHTTLEIANLRHSVTHSLSQSVTHLGQFGKMKIFSKHFNQIFLMENKPNPIKQLSTLPNKPKKIFSGVYHSRNSRRSSLSHSLSNTFVTIWKNENIFKTFKPNIFKTFKPNIFGGKYFQNIKKTQKKCKNAPFFEKTYFFRKKTQNAPFFEKKTYFLRKKRKKAPFFEKTYFFQKNAPFFEKKHTFLFSLTLVTREN